jgi:hypothetical protein
MGPDSGEAKQFWNRLTFPKRREVLRKTGLSTEIESDSWEELPRHVRFKIWSFYRRVANTEDE